MGVFSGEKSWNSSDSYSGLRTAKGGGNAAFTNLLTRTPTDIGFAADNLKGQMANQNPFGVGANGFTDAQMAGVTQFGKNMFNDVSSNYAGRGFNSPENVSGVVGSALTNAAPTLMSQIFQNQMGTQQVNSDRANSFNNLLSLYNPLLGQENHSFGSQRGMSPFGTAIGGAAQGAGGAAGAAAMAAFI